MELISGMEKKVDRPGTRETVPDRFRLIPDDCLVKMQFFEESNDFFLKNMPFFKKSPPKKKAAYGIAPRICG